jgi:hypothetical protein
VLARGQCREAGAAPDLARVNAERQGAAPELARGQCREAGAAPELARGQCSEAGAAQMPGAPQHGTPSFLPEGHLGRGERIRTSVFLLPNRRPSRHRRSQPLATVENHWIRDRRSRPTVRGIHSLSHAIYFTGASRTGTGIRAPPPRPPTGIQALDPHVRRGESCRRGVQGADGVLVFVRQGPERARGDEGAELTGRPTLSNKRQLILPVRLPPASRVLGE